MSNVPTPPEPTFPQPQIHLPENAFSESPYSVELGDQRFTEGQWKVIEAYARGFHLSRLAEGPHLAQTQNARFHEAMGIYTAPRPRAIPADDIPVVMELIREEFIELIDALGAEVTFTPDGKFDTIRRARDVDVVETYDALIDILYVTYGALNRAGMNAKPGYDEVQGSNMSKLGPDGKPIIAGPNDPDGIFPGRVKKGPLYYKPNLRAVLREQGWQGDGS